MLLEPVNRKLAIRDPKLEDLYKARECHRSEFWGKPYRHSPYRDTYRCSDLNRASSLLISLAVERTDGYFIPGTDLPYILLAMRVLAEMNKLNALDEHQLAGLAWVLVYHKFASVEEVREICGDYIAELVTVTRYRRDEKNMDDFFLVIDDKDEPDTFIVLDEIQQRFMRVETALILDVLKNIRIKHDIMFCRENPKPNEYVWEEASTIGYNSQDDDDREDNEILDDDEAEKYGCFWPGYDGPYCRRTIEYDYRYYSAADREYSGLFYYKKGFCNQEHKEYEYGYMPGDIVKYPYTSEYMAYCDTCRDLFWQRFGLTYEEVESTLIKLFWDGSSPWNPLNDLLYEVERRYYVNW